jgi:hypothetical protein
MRRFRAERMACWAVPTLRYQTESTQIGASDIRLSVRLATGTPSSMLSSAHGPCTLEICHFRMFLELNTILA